MKRKAQIDPEIQKLKNLETDLRDMRNAVEYGIIPLNPTRSFQPGERIVLGNHGEVYVRESHMDGLFYTCESINVQRHKDAPPSNEFHVRPWFDIYKYGQELSSQFTKEEKYRITNSNAGIDSLLNMVYSESSGVDFNVEYQREHVWELEDKVNLIDSVYNNIDIGKFVFVQLPMSTKGKLYQIIDGKQRLTALCEFYEDRFPYKGVYYSQLSWKDKHTFKNYSITYGYLQNPDLRGIYETFVKLNTCGKPMDHKHIDKVKELINKLDNV